ncbi:MAG: DegT/DnrJ/EryC1/StrS family aminotransferase [Chloroflexi bacterium]|nr:DegT/DnrJ/EryC1/StrS family aminotransferase [Chloroflexota bacterium]
MGQPVQPPDGELIPVARPVLGDEEIEAVASVLRSGRLVQGAIVEKFERAFADLVGVQHAVAVSSGTAALHLALLAHGIGPGDEVITSPFTFVATANAALYAGAIPVFADIRNDTLNIDTDAIEAKITPRTRAILPVHLYGHPADMEAVQVLADQYHLSIIEDAAQAHGATVHGRQVGTFGTGCFSFYATKNATTGEGGIVTTDSAAIAETVRLLRHHGQHERYFHEILGFNYRLTDIQAALGLVQLERLTALTERRIANARYLSSRLDQVATPTTLPGYRHVFHQYTIRLPYERDAIARQLGHAGIGSSVHYPLPVHLQPLYWRLGYRDSLPHAERASHEVLSLPIHPLLSRSDLDVVASGVLAALDAVSLPRAPEAVAR